VNGPERRLIKIGLWIAIILLGIRCLISIPDGIYGFISSIGGIVCISIIFLGFYERLIWQFNPMEKIPRINGTYLGTIEYNFDGNSGIKRTQVEIKQTLLSTRVKTITDEITSYTISSSLIEENGEFILYYTYVTNPKSKYSKDNPVQYGTCRLVIISKDELRGNYWTTRQTIGDMVLRKCDKK